MDSDSFECPECGAAIRARKRSIVWHVLNTWHNPITTFVNAMRGGMPVREIVGWSFLGLLGGTGLVAAVIWLVER